MVPTDLFARYPLSRQAIVVLHDVGAVVVALPLAIMLRESGMLDGERLAYILSCLPLLFAAALAAIMMLGSYRAVWRYMGIGEITRLAQFTAAAILLFLLGQFLVDRLDHLPRSAPAIQFLVTMFILIGSRIGYGAWCRWRNGASIGRIHRQPLLLVGSGDSTALFIQMLTQRPRADHEILGIVCDDLSLHRSVNGAPVLGTLAEIDAVLARLRVQGMTPARIVLTRSHDELGEEATRHVMQRAHAARIPVDQFTDLMRFFGDTRPSSAPSPAVSDAVAELSTYHRLRRGFDIGAAAVILLAAAPLLALASLAVAIWIQRPVLFVQIRPGLAGHPFRLLKLRTMKDPLAPDGRRLTDAERTPWVGRLLRRIRLDEFPQFINVLKGDMALVGPRPLIVSDLDAMPDQGRRRSRTRPGITGWAQVSGGPQLHPREKYALDRWYAENASLALDATILWRTVLMIFLGEKRDEGAITSALALEPVTLGAAK